MSGMGESDNPTTDLPPAADAPPAGQNPDDVATDLADGQATLVEEAGEDEPRAVRKDGPGWS